jgi:hypothetical protein
MSKNTLIHEIQHALNTDDLSDSQKAKQSAAISLFYKEGGVEVQNLLDDVFTALCGYSLGTLIDESEEDMIE